MWKNQDFTSNCGKASPLFLLGGKISRKIASAFTNTEMSIFLLHNFF
jgi:hypothetical protein